MIEIRSLLFNAFLILWTLILCIIGLPILFLSLESLLKWGRLWCRGTFIVLSVLCGLKVEVRGKENIPSGPCIIASKHQSALETIMFYLISDRPAFILKKELLRLPFFGLFVRKAKAIAVDRKAGAAALRDMVAQALERLQENRQVVIFPEGTRVKIGETKRYQPGIAAIYLKANVPVVPMALNTGIYWGKNSFLKKPGTAIIELLPPIPPGLHKDEFMELLEKTIENKTAELFRNQSS